MQINGTLSDWLIIAWRKARAGKVYKDRWRIARLGREGKGGERGRRRI